MERYRLTKLRICLTMRLVFLGSVPSTSWSASKVGRASKKFSTSCCFCSRGMRTRVRPVPLEVRAYRTGTAIPKAPSDSRRASLRSFCTMGTTFFSSLVLLADFHMCFHIKHYNKNAREVNSRFCDLTNEGKIKKRGIGPV